MPRAVGGAYPLFLLLSVSNNSIPVATHPPAAELSPPVTQTLALPTPSIRSPSPLSTIQYPLTLSQRPQTNCHPWYHPYHPPQLSTPSLFPIHPLSIRFSTSLQIPLQSIHVPCTFRPSILPIPFFRPLHPPSIYSPPIYVPSNPSPTRPYSLSPPLQPPSISTLAPSQFPLDSNPPHLIPRPSH